jgi:hypothetical protein
MPDFPDIAGKYTSLAYNFSVHPSPSQEITQKKSEREPGGWKKYTRNHANKYSWHTFSKLGRGNY